jgi:CubicO group peptidase (beta-lactamase class C family)
MDAAITQAIEQKRCPGGVLWLEREGQAYHKAYGLRAIVPTPETMTEDTVFDAASLTKVIACTPAVMRLWEQGRLSLDAPVTQHIPEFKGDGKEVITVRQLLTHTSGLPPGISGQGWQGTDGAIRKAATVKLDTTPGTAFKYSDINFFLLGEIVHRVSDRPLNQFVKQEFFVPLKMNDTGYLPPTAWLARVAPTEIEGTNPPLRGVVHDPTARLMGGVAGHAGLFTTAADLARFARMLLNNGKLDGVRVLKPETVRAMIAVQTPPALTTKRGFGWDIDSSYSGLRGEIFPVGSYGHTGWTGTSIWIDPASRTFVIFLSNRNHPTKDGNVLPLRRTLGTLAAETVGLSKPAAP